MKERILIIESSDIVAEGLKSIIGTGIPDSVIYCITDKSCSIAEEISGTGASVVIMNPLDRMCSYPLQAKKIRKENPDVRMFALVRQHTETSVLSGYDGIMDVNDSRERIIETVKKVRNRTSVPEPDNMELSEREKTVLVLITEGLMSKEIADRLNISIHTVNSHRKNISRKTGIKSVAGLTLYAMLNGLRD